MIKLFFLTFLFIQPSWAIEWSEVENASGYMVYYQILGDKIDNCDAVQDLNYIVDVGDVIQWEPKLPHFLHGVAYKFQVSPYAVVEEIGAKYIFGLSSQAVCFFVGDEFRIDRLDFYRKTDTEERENGKNNKDTPDDDDPSGGSSGGMRYDGGSGGQRGSDGEHDKLVPQRESGEQLGEDAGRVHSVLGQRQDFNYGRVRYASHPGSKWRRSKLRPLRQGSARDSKIPKALFSSKSILPGRDLHASKQAERVRVFDDNRQAHSPDRSKTWLWGSGLFFCILAITLFLKRRLLQ